MKPAKKKEETAERYRYFLLTGEAIYRFCLMLSDQVRKAKPSPASRKSLLASAITNEKRAKKEPDGKHKRCNRTSIQGELPHAPKPDRA